MQVADMRNTHSQAPAPTSAGQAAAMQPAAVMSAADPSPTLLEPSRNLAAPFAPPEAIAGPPGGEGPNLAATPVPVADYRADQSERVRKDARLPTTGLSVSGPFAKPYRVRVPRVCASNGGPEKGSSQKSGTTVQEPNIDAEKSGTVSGSAVEGGSPTAAGSMPQKTRRWKRALMCPSSSSEHLNKRFQDAIGWHSSTLDPCVAADTAATTAADVSMGQASAPLAATSANAAPSAEPAFSVLAAELPAEADDAAAPADATHGASLKPALQGTALSSQLPAKVPQKRNFQYLSPLAASSGTPRPTLSTTAAAATASAAEVPAAVGDHRAVLTGTGPVQTGSPKRPRLDNPAAKRDQPASAAAYTQSLAPQAADRQILCDGQDVAIATDVDTAEDASMPCHPDALLLPGGDVVGSMAVEILPVVPVSQAGGALTPAAEDADLDANETTMRVITLHGEHVQARVLQEADSDQDIEID